MIYNKERPRTFDQIIGQKSIVENIRNQSIRDHFFPVFILCGQLGSGKTTMARLIAMAANCTQKDVSGNPCGKCDSCHAVLEGTSEGIIEIDGASNNGVESIRKLLTQASTMGIFRKKVIVIDEAHMLSKSAFNALLITLENPPPHCIFILCTTEVEALPETVVSRAPVYTFGKIPDNLIKQHILFVAEKNKIRITEDAASILSRYANGAMRNALQLLEHISMQKDKEAVIEEQDVTHILGLSSLEQRAAFLDGCLANDIEAIMLVLRHCEDNGISLKNFLQDTLRMNADLLLASSGAEVVGTEFYLSRLSELNKYSIKDIIQTSKILSKISANSDNCISVERVAVDVISSLAEPSRTFYGASEKRGSKVTEPQMQTNQCLQVTDHKENKEQLSENSGSKNDPEFQMAEESPFETMADSHGPITNLFGNIFGSILGGVTASESLVQPVKGKKKTFGGACDLREMSSMSCQQSTDFEEQNNSNKKNPELCIQEDTKVTEGNLSWEDMVAMGLVPRELTLPAPETEEELEKVYEKRVTEPVKGEEEEDYRTKTDLINDKKKLEKLLKDPGFKLLYNKARVEEKDFQIYLFFDKQAYLEAAKVFLKGENDIIAILEEKEG